jgi:hypothetical protein
VANPNTPFGMRPYAYQSGAPYGGAVRVYYVPSGNATALFFGDPVVNITNTSDGNGIQAAEIATAASTNQILGSFMGRANNAGSKVVTLLQSDRPSLPASTEAYIYVSDDPFLLYLLQEDSVGGSMVSGVSGQNASLIAGSGSTVTNQSGWLLDSSTVATSNLQMRIIQGLQEVDNTIGQSFAKWLCKINQGIHPFTTSSGT